jgi:N-acetylneuraminic acid mutarotase
MQIKRLKIAVLVAAVVTLGLAGCGSSTVYNPPPATGPFLAKSQWTWVSGAPGAPAVYGSLGVAATANLPGARIGAVSWTDTSGNLWLFGGEGMDAQGYAGLLNDLWEFNPSTKMWTWVGGSNMLNAAGVYGTQGVAAATNTPGARENAVSWTDSSGNFWLFGGEAIDAQGNAAFFNDLWEFSPTTKMWTWMSGSNTPNTAGVYGTQGVAAATNLPAPVEAANTWMDASGNLWLFGGFGYTTSNGLATSEASYSNDLWEYNPNIKMWTWVNGSGEGVAPAYGTQGVAAATNVPGARAYAASWMDASGNLWLFGGFGFVSLSSQGNLNDLWEFNPTTKMWTWIGGSNTTGALGVYGTQGAAAATNTPGARNSAVTWTDSSGNFWLLGGASSDLYGNEVEMNDLWEFNSTTKMWAWVGGPNTPMLTGNYGTIGVASATNFPLSRDGAVSWVDSSGNFWLFGGDADAGLLGDLWVYQP